MSLIVWGHDLPPYQYFITITSIFWYHYTTQIYHIILSVIHICMCGGISFWELSNTRKLTAIFWNSSKNENEASSCFPFRVAFNDDQGHFLIATRDIQPGELVMKDRPFAEGPGSKSPPVCLQCAKDAPTYRCSKWVWMST